jgi:hypothetical protein
MFGDTAGDTGGDETFEGYHAWRRAEDGARWLARVGLPLGRVEHRHRELALRAQLDDPAAASRPLIRHASREERARLKGAALLADDLCDMAEVLRRYAELYDGCTWIEEDDARHGPRGAEVKRRLYGAPRIGDSARTVFRRLMRAYELNPQPRVVWFVEGETEMAFVPHWARLQGIDFGRAGIELMNAHGVGGIASKRLRGLLDPHCREEAFAFIWLDRETHADHVRTLRKYAADRLLIAGYRVWHPDFEQANFTLDELAQVANGLALKAGADVRLTADAIGDEIARTGKAAFEAIKALWGGRTSTTARAKCSARRWPSGRRPTQRRPRWRRTGNVRSSRAWSSCSGASGPTTRSYRSAHWWTRPGGSWSGPSTSRPMGRPPGEQPGEAASSAARLSGIALQDERRGHDLLQPWTVVGQPVQAKLLLLVQLAIPDPGSLQPHQELRPAADQVERDGTAPPAQSAPQHDFATEPGRRPRSPDQPAAASGRLGEARS